MSIVLNLTVMPLLGILAVVLLYTQIGFICALFIAIKATFNNRNSLKFVLYYLIAIGISMGLSVLFTKLSYWIVGLAQGKVWGFYGLVLISLFTSTEIITKFIRIAKEQTSAQ